MKVQLMFPAGAKLALLGKTKTCRQFTSLESCSHTRGNMGKVRMVEQAFFTVKVTQARASAGSDLHIKHGTKATAEGCRDAAQCQPATRQITATTAPTARKARGETRVHTARGASEQGWCSLTLHLKSCLNLDLMEIASVTQN